MWLSSALRASVQPSSSTISLEALRTSTQSGVRPAASRKRRPLEVITSLSCTVSEASISATAVTAPPPAAPPVREKPLGRSACNTTPSASTPTQMRMKGSMERFCGTKGRAGAACARGTGGRLPCGRLPLCGWLPPCGWAAPAERGVLGTDMLRALAGVGHQGGVLHAGDVVEAL